MKDSAYNFMSKHHSYVRHVGVIVLHLPNSPCSAAAYQGRVNCIGLSVGSERARSRPAAGVHVSPLHDKAVATLPGHGLKVVITALRRNDLAVVAGGCAGSTGWAK